LSDSSNKKLVSRLRDLCKSLESDQSVSLDKTPRRSQKYARQTTVSPSPAFGLSRSRSGPMSLRSAQPKYKGKTVIEEDGDEEFTDT